MPEGQKIEMRNTTRMEAPPELGFDQFMEKLRTRFNVLNTSVFLLEDNLNTNSGNKTTQYIHKINLELKRIRKLINQVPEKLKQQK